MYQFYRTPFNSPFAGLFLPPDEYLRLLENPGAMNGPMRMTDRNHSRYAATYESERNYPVGILAGDIEVHFLHYQSPAEAHDKWMRRVRRINPGNMIVKFHQGPGCTDEHVRRFAALPYPAKVCFTSHAVDGAGDCIVVLPEFRGHPTLDGRYWKTADLHYNLARHANSLL